MKKDKLTKEQAEAVNNVLVAHNWKDFEFESGSIGQAYRKSEVDGEFNGMIVHVKLEEYYDFEIDHGDKWTPPYTELSNHRVTIEELTIIDMDLDEVVFVSDDLHMAKEDVYLVIDSIL